MHLSIPLLASAATMALAIHPLYPEKSKGNLLITSASSQLYPKASREAFRMQYIQLAIKRLLLVLRLLRPRAGRKGKRSAKVADQLRLVARDIGAEFGQLYAHEAEDDYGFYFARDAGDFDYLDYEY